MDRRRTSKKSFLLAGALVLVCGLASGTDVAVTADKVVHTRSGYHLNLSVWNCSKQVLQVKNGDLPWQQDTLTLVVASGGASPTENLERWSSIEDWPDKEVAIAPGKSLQGSIDLTATFPGLAKSRFKKTSVVFWSYDLQRLDHMQPRPVGGMLPLDPPPSAQSKALTPCT
jgi:hypothetical protein